MIKPFGQPSNFTQAPAEANVRKGLTVAELSKVPHGSRLVIKRDGEEVGTLRMLANDRKTGRVHVSLVSETDDGYARLELPLGGGFLERKRKMTPTFFYAVDVESGDVSEDFKVAELMIGDPTPVPDMENRYELILSNAEGTRWMSVPLGEVEITVEESVQ